MTRTSKLRAATKALLHNRISCHLNRFRHDESGVSTIEFAVVSPFLLISWLGLAAILDTENTTTKVGKVTSTVADMIAQSRFADADFINAAFDAGKAMLGTVGNDSLKIYVAGLRVNADQTVDVVWICGRRFTEDEMDNAVEELDVPSQLKQAPGFIIASYGEYKHSPLFGEEFSGEQTYKYNNYFVPRHSLETLNDGCDG